MQTREEARGVATQARPEHGGLFTGIGRTALMVGSALLASILLILIVATVTICWEIHPILTIGVVIVLGWLLTRLAGLVLSTGRRATD